MRKNRTKHEAKKPRLAKRALALCFALIFVCSCLLPAFANSEVGALADPLTMVEQKDEQQPTEPAPLTEGGTDSTEGNEQHQTTDNPTEGNEQKTTDNPTEEPKPAEQEPKADEPKNEEPKTEETKNEGTTESKDSTEEQPKTEGTTESKDSTEEQPKPEETKPEGTTEEPKTEEPKQPTTNTTGDTIEQGKATYTYRFWPDKIDAFELEAINDDVKAGTSLKEAAQSRAGMVPCTVLTVMTNANLRDYQANVQQPIKSGYEFAGWYTVDGTTEDEFSFEQSLNFEKSKTIDVFAKWNELVTLRETVNVVLGGEAVADEYSYDDDRMAAPTTLTLDVEATNLSSNSKLSVSSTSSSAIDTYCKNNDLTPILTLDITPKDKDSGKKTEPQETSTVTISGLSELELPEKLTMVHKKDDGEIETITAEYSNGTLTFKATSFSPYALAVDLGETAKAKQIKKVNDVSIEDDTLNTGRFILKANITTKDNVTTDYTGEEAGKLLVANGYTITWNNGSDIAYGQITLDNGKHVENSAQNGGWVNVSYTYPKGMEKSLVTYTVTVAKGTETHTESKDTAYYKQLMNGSFEECTFQYDHSAPLFKVPYWNATQNDNLLEVIGTGYSPLENYFNNPWKRYVRHEQHAVELNATNEGTLYQTVLTVPGQTLYWSFSHRARTVSISGKTGFDKMAMLIVPEALAEKLSESGDEYLRNWAIGKGQTVTNGKFITVDDETDVNGKPYQIYVAQHQSEVTKSGWYYDSQWGDMSGSLTVPDNWYVVRFFFVAVETCSGNISVGNIVDAVSFSQEVPSFEGYGAANVTVTKKVYGLGDLTDTKARELLDSKSFIDDVVLGNWTRKEDSDGVYYEASGTVTEGMFSDKNVTYKEVFEHAQLDGYDLTAAKWKCGNGEWHNADLADGELVATTTLRKGDTKNIVFTNTYTPETLDIKITKNLTTHDSSKTFKFKVTGNLGNEEKRPLVDENGKQLKRVEGFEMKDGKTVTLKNVEAGMHVNVTEFDRYNYDVTATNYDGKPAIPNSDGEKTFEYEVKLLNGELVLVDSAGNAVADNHITVTNTPATTSLTVTKTATKDNVEDTTTEFNFTLTLGSKSENVTWSKRSATGVTTGGNVTSKPYTFTLKGGESITFNGISVEDNSVTVTEDNYSAQHYTTTVNDQPGREFEVSATILKDNQEAGTTVNFVNEYTTPKLNSMTIQKKVTGAFGERTKEFAFSVTMTNDKGLDTSGVTHSVTDLTNFKLRHGDSVTLGEIPIGTTITVTESNAKDYKTSATGHKNSIKNSGERTFTYKVVEEGGVAVLKSLGEDSEGFTGKVITVENNFDGTPDTGVLLDTLPYLILLAVAVAGGVLVVVRKRKHRDE